MHLLPVPSFFCFLRYAVLHFSCFFLYFCLQVSIIIIIIIIIMSLCILGFGPEGGIIHVLATGYRRKMHPLDMKLGRPQRNALGRRNRFYTYRKLNQIPHYTVVRLQNKRSCRITSSHLSILFRRALYSPGHQLL